jgi:DmsE family decaheme c-type cytochrome
MKCHDEAPVTNILGTPHAVKGDIHTPFAQHGCESCHGASPEHLHSHPDKGQKPTEPAIVFVGPAASPVAERNKACLSCHESGLRMNWQGSQHENNEVACTSCHTIHIKKDPVLGRTTQPEKCFTCHAQQRAESFELSHHPIREGKVVCSDCHNPHGSAGPKLLKEFTLNDTCYTCHADKRGPFMWEHEPVRDGCNNCHTPHGSTQVRLLKERPPFLCTQCHDEGGHQAAVFSANLLPGTAGVYTNGVNGVASGQSAVNPRMIARGCVNCHSQVHGSNSQAGSFFTR